jgi:radical SAM protein with 4Fe4S-binding SPASM domain
MYKYCSQPYNTISIHPTGDVFSCICSAFHTQKPIGNIKTQTLDEMFNSAQQQDFRNTIIDQSFRYCRPICGTTPVMVDAFPDITTQKKLMPARIMIAVDKNCNLKCGSCRTGNIYSPAIDPNAMLILNRLNDFYQDYTDPVYIRGDGTGDMFSSAAWRAFLNNPNLAKCFRFQIISNGNLITKNIELITSIRSQLHTIEITFDAATPETYTAVRGGKFESIIAGVQALKNLGIEVHAQYVTQQKNYHEIVDYCKLCQELEINYISLNSIHRWHHMSDEYWAANRLEDNPNVDYETFVSNLEQIHNNKLGNINNVLLNFIKDYRAKITA